MFVMRGDHQEPYLVDQVLHLIDDQMVVNLVED
jgi:hypothetical protein